MKNNKNVVFAHDHMFYKDKKSGKVYSKTSLKQSAWDRYLNCFKSVTVISRMKNMESYSDIAKLSLSSREGIIYSPVPSISGLKNLFLNYKKTYLKMKKTIVESDGVIARLPSEIGSLAIDIAKKYNKPYAIEVVACTWDGLWNYGSLQGKLYAPISYLRTRKQVSSSNHVIYVTEKFLQNRYPNNKYNTNCSNVELISDFQNEDVIENRLSKVRSDKKKIKIGLIGNLSIKSKGIDIAIKAMERICRNNSNYELHIVGAGDSSQYNSLIRELGVDKYVKFEGTIQSGKKIYEWLDSMDIYIQPSFQEGLPRATIEAMSRGCLCIGSTAGGLPELLDKKFIHKKGSYNELSELILKYSEDKIELENQALVNYNNSKKYEKSILEDRRSVFWCNFRDGL